MAFFANVKKVLNTSIRQFYAFILKKIVSGKVLLTRTQKIGMTGVCIFIFGILIRTIIFPSILESSLRKEVALTKGSFRRETWSRLPFACELRVHLFNVTNPNEIGKGEKPNLEEIGPFVYDIWQEKTNQVDDDESDTVTYSVNNTYFFNAEKSNNLSDDIELNLARIMTFGTANAVMKETPAFIPLAARAVDSVEKNPSSLFEKMKVKTFLFDGQVVNCVGINDFFGLAMCNDARDFYVKYRMRKRAEKIYEFSTFGGMNDTDIYHGKIRIRRGTKDLMTVGDVVEYKDLKNLSIWKDDECDRFRGTEGTMFHPFLDKKKNKYLYITSTFYCRTLTYKYETSVKYKGLKLLRYTTTVGTDMETNEKDKCYCITPDRCLKNGVYEIWKCFFNAYVLSNPHFYLADPSYVDGVEGVNPSKDKHMTILDIDPLTGLAVRTHFRVQYNFLLMNLKKYRLMKEVRDALFPLIWVDEVMILPDFIIKRIKKLYVMVIVAKVVSYLIMSIGLVMCGYALFCEYKLRKK